MSTPVASSRCALTAVSISSKYVALFMWPSTSSSWSLSMPSVDVSETDKEIEVTAELPGMDEKDIDVSLAEGVLTIRGEKRSEVEK